jgi:lambda family phage portal protein
MNMLSGLRNFFAPKPIVKAQYDNAKIPTRRKAGWDYTNASASGATTPYMPALKNRARAAVRNDPWAARALDAMVSNLIGTGITPRPATKDEALRTKLIELWDEWAGECDSTGVLDIYGIQALVARAWYESGEVFIRLRPRYADDLEVPLQLQIIESDQVSYKNEVLDNGNVIRSGIEYNAIGSRVAYWIHPNHPGDTLVKNQGDNNDPKRIPASEVLHVFKPLRPGQDRGVTLFAQVLSKLESLNKFDDAVLFRQELANLFVAFIRQNPDLSPVLETETGEEINAADVIEETMLKPGATRILEPGEDVAFSTPPDAGSNYNDFTRQQVMSLAAGIGIPYELLSGDYSLVNDRTIRVALNDYRRKLESDQWNIIIAQFLKPMRKAWVDAAILNGHITIEQRKDAIATHWTPHAHAYINPVQDVQANIAAVKAGFKSRAEVIRERGYDISEIDSERMADKHAPKQ